MWDYFIFYKYIILFCIFRICSISILPFNYWKSFSFFLVLWSNAKCIFRQLRSLPFFYAQYTIYQNTTIRRRSYFFNTSAGVVNLVNNGMLLIWPQHWKVTSLFLVSICASKNLVHNTTNIFNHKISRTQYMKKKKRKKEKTENHAKCLWFKTTWIRYLSWITILNDIWELRLFLIQNYSVVRYDIFTVKI